jgi:hypothetical protein
MTKASENEFPKVTFAEGAAPGTPASGLVIAYAKADGLLYSKDDAGSETPLGAAAGGGINSGTSFPGSPAAGDLFHRTNLRIPLWRYDGTRWLCTCVHEISFGGTEILNNVTTAATWAWLPVRSDFGIYIDELKAVTRVVTTLSGSAYYTIDLNRHAADNTATSVGSFNLSADTVNAWTEHTIAVAAVLNATARALGLGVTKTGSPGALRLSAMLVHRLIGT